MGNITDAVLASMLKELIQNQMIERHSYDEIPPRVEYSLQSICKWSGIYYREDSENTMIQCQKCDYKE